MAEKYIFSTMKYAIIFNNAIDLTSFIIFFTLHSLNCKLIKTLLLK
jgi:hypothetical protein